MSSLDQPYNQTFSRPAPVAPQGAYNPYNGGFSAAANIFPARPEEAGPRQGADFGSAFMQFLLQQMGQQNSSQQGNRQLQRDVLLGQHLGSGGGQITPSNPTGNLSNPWAADGLFGGNATHQAAQAINAQPLWSQGPGGQLIHGTNYPGFAPAGVGNSTPPASAAVPYGQVLPQMNPAEQRLTTLRYNPPRF